MAVEEGNKKLFLFCTSFLLLLILIYPWIFGISCLFFFAGFYFLEKIVDNIQVYILRSAPTTSSEGSSDPVYQLDPLLHPTPFTTDNQEKKGEEFEIRKGSSASSGGKPDRSCPVCDEESCTRSEKGGCHCEYYYGMKRPDLFVAPVLDKALSRFCSTVFDFYISTNWAPYETRKQLKLAFKQLLCNFGRQLEKSLTQDDQAVIFCQEKIIPLCIHYLDKLRNKKGNIKSCEKSRRESNKKLLERIANRKTQRLCRKLLEQNLPLDDQKCGLWLELCVAVLADGVLWNLILLGRDKLPPLFVDLTKTYKYKDSKNLPTTIDFITSMILSNSTSNKNTNSDPNARIDCSSNKNLAVATECETEGVTENQSRISSTESNSGKPLLLNYLDPGNDLFQPDEIVSRWRPCLAEILNERDLLYCLIQYLKKFRSLEYLQAVLDDSPDGNDYCKSVLEFEYLPAFTRSKFFMEKLGVSQVDCALEAGMDSPGSRRKMGHTRSSSYGGGNSGIQIWKIGDPKAIDGLPLHANPIAAAGYTDSDYMLRRRQYSLEVVINKFMTSSFGEASKEESGSDSCPPTCRIGVDAKTYADTAEDDVLSELVIGPCDLYDCLTEAGISCINNNMWIQPVLGGWAKQLRPFMKPYFDHYLEAQLREKLSIATCAYLIDLITDAFLANVPERSAVDIGETVRIDVDESSNFQNSNRSSENLAGIRESLLGLSQWFLAQFVNLEHFAQIISENDDEIILFFVDLIDTIVTHVSETTKVNARTEVQ